MSDPMLEKLSEISEAQARILANQENDRKILDSHTDKFNEVSRILTRNTITVEDHKRRSLALEQRQSKVESRQDRVDDYVKIQKAKRLGAKEVLTWISWLFTGVSGLGASVWGIYEFLKKLGA